MRKVERGPIMADQQELRHPGSLSTMRLRSRTRSADEWCEPVRGVDFRDRLPAGLRNDSQLCSESKSAYSALHVVTSSTGLKYIERLAGRGATTVSRQRIGTIDYSSLPILPRFLADHFAQGNRESSL